MPEPDLHVHDDATASRFTLRRNGAMVGLAAAWVRDRPELHELVVR